VGSDTRYAQMMLLSKLPAFSGIIGTVTIAIAIALASHVHAYPVWHDFDSRNSLDSFISGSSYLLAGGVKFGVPYYLTTPPPTGMSVLAGHAISIYLSHTRPQGRPVTSPFLFYPVQTAPRYSLYTITNSIITRTNLTSYMSTP
jgi:hypothetical protein